MGHFPTASPIFGIFRVWPLHFRHRYIVPASSFCELSVYTFEHLKNGFGNLLYDIAFLQTL